MIRPTPTRLRDFCRQARERATDTVSIAVAATTAWTLGFLHEAGFLEGVRAGLSAQILHDLTRGMGYRLRLDAALDVLRDLVDNEDHRAFLSKHQEDQLRFILETLEKSLR